MEDSAFHSAMECTNVVFIKILFSSHIFIYLCLDDTSKRVFDESQAAHALRDANVTKKEKKKKEAMGRATGQRVLFLSTEGDGRSRSRLAEGKTMKNLLRQTCKSQFIFILYFAFPDPVTR
uniref:Uncharacterized protein n=1 Tax=Strigamia maritima TaxID=126957 RepID=T1JDQ4_STRMM